MAFPYALVGIGLGANLLGGLASGSAERKRLKKQREEALTALRPLEALLKQRKMGLTESEGALARRLGGQATRGVAARLGTTNTTALAPAVFEAVAPIDLQRERDIMGLTQALTEAKLGIAGIPEGPGFWDAFGGALGDVGGLLALTAGMNYAASLNPAAAKTPLEQMILESVRNGGQLRTGPSRAYTAYGPPPVRSR